jgi:hypothetical protein
MLKRPDWRALQQNRKARQPVQLRLHLKGRRYA